MDVLVSERDAATNTYLVGDLYTMHSSFGSAIDLNLPVRVAGVWRPSNPNSDYWFYSPGTFGSMALLPEASFAAAVNSDVPWVSYMAWYTALDHRSVRSADVAPLREQIAAASAAIQRLLPGVELSRSPLEALQQHADQVRLLTVTLALFAVPLLGLVWLFVVQVARMLVESQRQEMALLLSRGSSRLQVVGLAVLEGVLLSVAAVLAGLGLGLATAQGMVWTQSFLPFVPRPGPPVELLSNSWMLGALVVGLGLPAVILPALGNSRYTIVSFKQERSRSTRKPLWKRLYLDLGLLAVAMYGYRQLRLQGSIPLPGVSTPSEDPWRNPVVLLAPALLVFALALFLLRLLPVGIAVLDRVFRRSRGTSLLTLRYLARDAGTYSGPVLLIALTLSLAAFTSSMARTLDEQTSARARYGSGADVRLVYQPRLQDASGGGSDEPILNTGPVDTNALPPEAPRRRVPGASRDREHD
ncbi:MAG: ABC transporter permease [Chloroflexia bacterium]